ncbi:DUF4115 domain-containing protein [Spiractinospora alimapuensis]|nr:DUF4115 domain-containing protein [Spiractinospora alimapuensis]
MAIAGAVLLLVTLVALGGFFLWQSIPSSNSAVLDDAAEMSSSDPDPGDTTLYLRVVGDSSDVLVRESGGQVLTDTTLGHGQYVSYDHPSMEVHISDPGAVEVYTNGELQDLSDEPDDATLSVRAD